MSAFIDLVGASGAVYRFKRFEQACPPAAGNLVFVREGDGAQQVVCCGKARTLIPARIQEAWAKDEAARPGDELYLRLNVVFRIRDQEHEDLVAGLPKPLAIYEAD